MTDYYARTHGHYQNGDVWSFGWHITSGQTLPGLLTTWSNAWIAAWTDGTFGIESLYHTDTVMDGWDVYSLNGIMRATFKDSLVNAQLGTSSDTPLPNRNAILVELQSPSVKKSGRGFSYLPAPVEGIVVNGSYTSVAMTRVKTAVNSVRTAINADGSTVFVFNRLVEKDLTPPFTKTVITSLRVSLKPSTQRRRTDPDVGIYV